METRNYVQKFELIEKLEQLIFKEFDDSPLSRLFPEAMGEVFMSYHGLAVFLSSFQYIHKSLVCDMIDLINHYNVPNSNVPDSRFNRQSKSSFPFKAKDSETR